MEAFHLGHQGPWDEGKSCRTEHLAPASGQRRKDPLGARFGRQDQRGESQGRGRGPGRGRGGAAPGVRGRLAASGRQGAT